jgi:hypothetical protein
VLPGSGTCLPVVTRTPSPPPEVPTHLMRRGQQQAQQAQGRQWQQQREVIDLT